MALDPSIILRNIAPQVDIGGQVRSGLETAGIFAKLRQQEEEAPIRQAILQNQSNLLAQQVATGAAEEQEATRKRDLKGLGSSYLQVQGDIAAGNFNSAADQLQVIYDQKIAAGQTPEDMLAHAQAIETLRSNDAEAIKDLKALGQGAIDVAVAEGLIDVQRGKLVERFSPTTVNLAGGVTVQTTSGGRKVVSDAEGNILKGQEAAEAIQEAERQEIESKIEIAKETTAARLGEQVKRVGVIEEEKVRGRVAGEAATVGTVAEIKSSIAAAIQTAKDKAASRGEKLSDLNRMEAGLPGLRETVDKLKELAPIATHTLAGKLFDTAVKELGFGATKGATARAKYISIIRNQVLPLLKQTFGGSFTVDEVNRLEGTLGDPDSTPGEKLAQLNSFVDNKVREIEGKKREIAGEQSPVPPDQPTDLSGMSDDEFKELLR